MNDIIPAKRETGRGEAYDAERGDFFEIGQWYWYNGTNHKGETERWLGCIMVIGSNYVEVQSPPRDRSYASRRVHVDELSKLEREHDADEIIQRSIQNSQERIGSLLGDVRKVTERITGTGTTGIEDKRTASSNALVLVSNQIDPNIYKRELIEAKEKTLPDLFKAIEEANKDLAMWMMAPTLPLQAEIGPMKNSIELVEDRIYTVELYAGLTEEAVPIQDGRPASIDEKLHVIQRRLYMDEECLCNYKAGGIELKTIEDFDAWLRKPENMERIFGYQRALVAFRVRRTEKEREDGGDAWQAFVNAQIAQADKKTFLYVRNGEQIWRVDCDFEFDEMLFPDQTVFDPSQPLMVKMWGNDRIEKMITRHEYEVRHAEYEEQRKLYEAWEAENPGVSWIKNPYHNTIGFRNEMNDYKPFDSTNVNFDEIAKHFSDEMKRYNRVAIIIQGLFDRSKALHPHGRVKVWDPVSFDSAISLVYDATTLTYGEAPDFEEYRAKLNESLGPDSIVTGQQDAWMRREAHRANERNERNRWRSGGRSTYYRRYAPNGDPGPGLVSRITEWKPRARSAVFRWMSQPEYSWEGQPRPKSITVGSAELFNVSAYQPGDYKRFFADPRTRREYFKWAPLMLAAEDYHAGKLTLNEFNKAESDYDYY